jgi:hypothetical protein
MNAAFSEASQGQLRLRARNLVASSGTGTPDGQRENAESYVAGVGMVHGVAVGGRLHGSRAGPRGRGIQGGGKGGRSGK